MRIGDVSTRTPNHKTRSLSRVMSLVHRWWRWRRFLPTRQHLMLRGVAAMLKRYGLNDLPPRKDPPPPHLISPEASFSLHCIALPCLALALVSSRLSLWSFLEECHHPRHKSKQRFSSVQWLPTSWRTSRASPEQSPCCVRAN